MNSPNIVGSATDNICVLDSGRETGIGEPFELLLSDPMIAIELRAVDAEELEQILKFSFAVVCGRHAPHLSAAARR